MNGVDVETVGGWPGIAVEAVGAVVVPGSGEVDRSFAAGEAPILPQLARTMTAPRETIVRNAARVLVDRRWTRTGRCGKPLRRISPPPRPTVLADRLLCGWPGRRLVATPR
jgi:hypothetical protein